MKRLMTIVLVLCLADKAGATFCNTYGNHTYCDDGVSYHKYGNDITELNPSGKQVNRYHDFGSHTYGNNGEWVADHGNGKYSSSGLEGKTRQVLPDILDENDGDSDEGSDDSGGE